MTAKLDVAEMEAAFKRAAHKAVHGTREERSGRFFSDSDGTASSGKLTPKQAAHEPNHPRRTAGRMGEA